MYLLKRSASIGALPKFGFTERNLVVIAAEHVIVRAGSGTNAREYRSEEMAMLFPCLL